MEKEPKYHKLVSFAISLGFLIVVQKFANPEPIFRFLVPAFLGLVIVVSLFNHWYLQKIQKYSFWTLLRPVLMLTSAFGLFLIIPSEGFRGLFLISAILVITFSQMLLGIMAENILIVEILLIAFGQFFTLAAFYQYAPVYGIYFVIASFIASTLLVRCFYDNIPKSDKVKITSSLILGLFTSQVFWVLNFLPFHFSVIAYILFTVFYFCLVTNYYYFFNILTFKRIQFHLFLITIFILGVLITTPWSVIQ